MTKMRFFANPTKIYIFKLSLPILLFAPILAIVALANGHFDLAFISFIITAITLVLSGIYK